MTSNHTSESEPTTSTTLSADLELVVSHDAHGVVHLDGLWPDPGDDWQFTPAEAREFARALSAHAARADARGLA